MALNISLEGVGVIANASSVTESIGTGTNQWNETGGGTDSWTSDTFLQGGESFAGAYSRQSGWQWYRTTTPHDFTSGGNAFGQYIWLWVNCPTLGLLVTKANIGISIRIGSSTTAYREYVIGGSDDSNGWLGDWKCFVVDPTNPSTTGAGNGTLALNDVQYIGVYIDTGNNNAKGDNIFIDQIAIASGLRMTGTWDNATYSGAWEEVATYCSDYATRAFGNLQPRGGVYYAQGNFYIGDTTQTATTLFEDSNKIIQWDKSEYWNGTAWVSTYPAAAAGIFIEDSASFSTQYNDGVIVGTDNGRNGCVYIGTDVQDVFIDASNASNNASSYIRWYGTTFRDALGASTFHSSSSSRIYGSVIARCGQFDPNGVASIKNSIISGSDATGAFLVDSTVDITNSSFISNTNAIEIAAGSSYTFTDLIFSGNTYDINNTTGGTVTVTKSGTTNASTFNPGGSTVTFLGDPRTFRINGILAGTEVRIINASTNTEIAGIENIEEFPTGVFESTGTISVSSSVDTQGTTRYSLTYSYQYVSTIPVRVAIVNRNYEIIYLQESLLDAAQVFSVSQQLDRNFSEGSVPAP